MHYFINNIIVVVAVSFAQRALRYWGLSAFGCPTCQIKNAYIHASSLSSLCRTNSYIRS